MEQQDAVLKNEEITKLINRIRDLIPGAIPLHIDRATINVLIDVLGREFDVKVRSVGSMYIDTVMSRIEMWCTPEIMDSHNDVRKLSEYGHDPKYLTVNNSSWHMTLYPKYYSNLVSVSQQMDQEERDPMCYSSISVVWDIKNKKALYIWHDKPEPIIPDEIDWTIYNIEKAHDDEKMLREQAERIKRQREYEEAVKFQMDTIRKAAEKERMYKLYVQSCLEQKPEPLVPVAIWDFDQDKCMEIRDGVVVAIEKIASDVAFVSTEKFAEDEMNSQDNVWDAILRLRQ